MSDNTPKSPLSRLFSGGPQKEETSDERFRRQRGRAGLYVVAGGYLAYLGLSLTKSVFADASVSQLMMIPGILFVLIGVLFVWIGIKGLLTKEETEETSENENAAGNVPEGTAVFEKGENEAIEDNASSAGGSPLRGMLSAATAAAVSAAETKPAGADIRDRLRKLNEMDGVEMEDISPDDEEEAILTENEPESTEGVFADETGETDSFDEADR